MLTKKLLTNICGRKTQKPNKDKKLDCLTKTQCKAEILCEDSED